jgi:hypothetical protein
MSRATPTQDDSCSRSQSARKKRVPSAVGPRVPPSLTAATACRSPRPLAVTRFFHALSENGVSKPESRVVFARRPPKSVELRADFALPVFEEADSFSEATR